MEILTTDQIVTASGDTSLIKNLWNLTLFDSVQGASKEWSVTFEVA